MSADDSLPPLSLPAGESLALPAGVSLGRFVVQGRVGGGGMGVVYAAYDPELDRRVAIKVVRSDILLADPRAEERFRSEARAMAQLAHPNVVRVYDVAVDKQVLYIAMEYVQGEDLARKAKRLREAGDWRGIVQVCVEAGQGLLAAHRQRLVHRDFKPQNVLCASDGRVLVVDFGLTRPLPAATLATGGQTRPAGTPGYAAPEQAAGLVSDERSDQYSFCVTLAECLGDRHGDPRRLQRILARGMSNRPEARYPTMAELLTELRGVLAARRRWGMLAFIAGLAVVAAGGGLWRRSVQLKRVTTLCSGGEERARAVWSDAVDEQVRQRLLATSKGNAAEVHARVSADLKRYRERWLESHRRACEAASSEGVSQEVLASQIRCLDHRLSALATLGIVWSRPLSAQAVDKANDLVAELPAVSECDDPLRLERAEVALVPAEREARFQALRNRIAALRVRASAGDEAGAEAELPSLEQEAQALAHPPASLALLLARARLRTRRDPNGAKPLLREALAKAGALNDDESAAEAALALFTIAAATDQQLEAAATLEPMVRATVERTRSARMRLELDLAQLTLCLIQGRFAEAVERAQAAKAQLSAAEKAGALGEPALSRGRVRVGKLELAALISLGRVPEAREEVARTQSLLARVYPPKHPGFADLASIRGMILLQDNQALAALESFREALAILDVVYGPDDPERVKPTHGLGMALEQLGRLSEAQAVFDKALTGARKTLGSDHEATTILVGTLAGIELKLGHLPRARTLIEEAIATTTRMLGARHPRLGFHHNTLGLVHVGAGDLSLAELSFRTALEMTRAVEPGNPDAAGPLANLGAVALQRGRFKDAVGYCREALELRRGSPDNSDLGEALTCLAEAELGLGRKSSALPLAEKAVALRTGAETEARERGRSAFALARALPASQCARARELATAARAGLDAQGGKEERRLRAAISGWLAGPACPAPGP